MFDKIIIQLRKIIKNFLQLQVMVAGGGGKFMLKHENIVTFLCCMEKKDTLFTDKTIFITNQN